MALASMSTRNIVQHRRRVLYLKVIILGKCQIIEVFEALK